jgi:hypothetical protein
VAHARVERAVVGVLDAVVAQEVAGSSVTGHRLKEMSWVSAGRE